MGDGIWGAFGDDRGRVAEVGPIDIGAQVFAADGASSSAFDGWAVFSWNVAASQPVIDHLRNYANRAGQNTLGAEMRNCLLKCFHGHDNKHVGMIGQQVVFGFVNICFKLTP